MRILIIFLTFIPTILFGQYATFIADTTDFHSEIASTARERDIVMQMEWRINGQVLRFGSAPIHIKTDPKKIDTILYRMLTNMPFDTIICNVKNPVTYKFVYNLCCGAFDVYGPGDKRLEGEVVFHLKGRAKGKKYLGILGESGVLVNVTDTLEWGCRSPMQPNIYPLQFEEVEVCSDTAKCKESVCISDRKKNERAYDLSYRTILRKVNVLYMPLSEPLHVTYDVPSRRVIIE